MLEKSRILLFTTSFRPLVGGSEIAIEEIVRRLPDIEFDIVTARGDPPSAFRETIGNMHIHRVGGTLERTRFILPKIFLPAAIFFQAWSLMRMHRYHILHAYQASQAAGAAWLLKWLYPNARLIVTLQEGKDLMAQGWLLNFFRRTIIKKANVVTAISDYLYEWAKTINPTAHVVLISNGIDPTLFYHRDATNIKQRLGIVDETIIMTVSRLVPKNGIGDLIQGIIELRIHRPEARFRLLIIGSGPLEEDLRRQAQPLGDKVSFVGTIPYQQLPEYLSVADIFIRPSRSEGLGTAFLEAMACGVPVIGSNVGGIPDIIKHEQTGLLVRPSNIEDIREALERLLDDKELRSQMALAGRAFVETQYTWDMAAGKFKSVYHDI